MSFKPCPPECNGPWASRTASGPRLNAKSKHDTRDQQRFKSVVQRLRDGNQQEAAPSASQQSSSLNHQQDWLPPKPGNRGVRMPEPAANANWAWPSFVNCLPDDPSLGFNSHQPWLPARRQAFAGPPSYGPIAPCSRLNKQRESASRGEQKT